jgi:hypothetical protein
MRGGVFNLAMVATIGCTGAASSGLTPCHFDEMGCPSDADPAAWETLARERGFPVDPGGDFFAYAQSGCHVDPIGAPRNLSELAQRSDLVVFGRIETVTVRVRAEATTDLAEYLVYLVVDEERFVKGTTREALLIEEPCSISGVKLAGLRNTLPDDVFLFFLQARVPPDLGREQFDLAWYYYGVVRQGDTGPEFAYRAEETEGFLREYDSLDEVAEVVLND